MRLKASKAPIDPYYLLYRFRFRAAAVHQSKLMHNYSTSSTRHKQLLKQLPFVGSSLFEDLPGTAVADAYIAQPLLHLRLALHTTFKGLSVTKPCLKPGGLETSGLHLLTIYYSHPTTSNEQHTHSSEPAGTVRID
jgi:hypothetical protein